VALQTHWTFPVARRLCPDTPVAPLPTNCTNIDFLNKELYIDTYLSDKIVCTNTQKFHIFCMISTCFRNLQLSIVDS